MPLSTTSSLPESTPCPPPSRKRAGYSAVQVDRVAGRSRLVRVVSQDPLKLIATRSGDADCCSVVASNYGGGFLQGDDAHLTVDCSADARLYLGTQALNKVYRCPSGLARQTVQGRLGSGARVASLPDPVMLFAESRFEQRQTWDVKEGGVLAVCDGMVSGRRELGEVFAFNSYTSHTRILRAGRPTAIETMTCVPEQLSPSRAGVFGENHLSYVMLLVGTPGEDCFESAANALEHAVSSVHAAEVRSAFTRPKEDVVAIRILAASLAAADGPMRQLNGSAAESLLDFNPINRKA